MASVPMFCRDDLPVVLLSMHLDCLANPCTMSDCSNGKMTLDYACDFTIQESRRFYFISSYFSSFYIPNMLNPSVLPSKT
jgi:hypothetical protein